MGDTEIWTTLKVLTWTKGYLHDKGIENARLESEWLLCAATGLDRVGLYLNFERPMSEKELTAFRTMVIRRGRREPLQHILGTQEFHGVDFQVSPQVLIPRHDTETLVNEALVRMPQAASVLDLGTGSGCIAVVLARELPAASITASDISPEALAVARSNAERNGVAVEFLQGSLFEPFRGRRFDLIVSNPPYIPSDQIDRLEPEVREWDPRIALDGGSDGLAIYRSLIPAAAEHLNPGGWLLVEQGSGQAEEVCRLFRQCGCYHEPVRVCDAAGIERVTGAQIL